MSQIYCVGFMSQKDKKIDEEVKMNMEPKIYTLIGLGVLIMGFIVVPTVFDRLDSMADDSPSDSAWNAPGDDIDLLKLLLGIVLVAIIVAWLSYRRDLGGGGM